MRLNQSNWLINPFRKSRSKLPPNRERIDRVCFFAFGVEAKFIGNLPVVRRFCCLLGAGPLAKSSILRQHPGFAILRRNQRIGRFGFAEFALFGIPFEVRGLGAGGDVGGMGVESDVGTYFGRGNRLFSGFDTTEEVADVEVMPLVVLIGSKWIDFVSLGFVVPFREDLPATAVHYQGGLFRRERPAHRAGHKVPLVCRHWTPTG